MIIAGRHAQSHWSQLRIGATEKRTSSQQRNLPTDGNCGDVQPGCIDQMRHISILQSCIVAARRQLVRKPGVETTVQSPNGSGHRRAHHEIAGPGEQNQLDRCSVSRAYVRRNREEIVESNDIHK